MGSRIRAYKRLFVILCLVILGYLAFPSVPSARPVIDMNEIEHAELLEFQCTVMEVLPKKDTLIAGEKVMEVVDFRKGNNGYRAILSDADGNTIPLAAFQKGQWVFVRAFRLSDGRIIAREIYRLPGMVAGKDKYPFFKKPLALKPVKLK